MIRIRTVVGAALVALALTPPAAAQMGQAEPPAPALSGFSLALQQLNVSARMMVEDYQRQLAGRDARIAELMQLCGDACKPPAKADPPKPQQ